MLFCYIVCCCFNLQLHPDSDVLHKSGHNHIVGTTSQCINHSVSFVFLYFTRKKNRPYYFIFPNAISIDPLAFVNCSITTFNLAIPKLNFLPRLISLSAQIFYITSNTSFPDPTIPTLPPSNLPLLKIDGNFLSAPGYAYLNTMTFAELHIYNLSFASHCTVGNMYLHNNLIDSFTSNFFGNISVSNLLIFSLSSNLNFENNWFSAICLSMSIHYPNAAFTKIPSSMTSIDHYPDLSAFVVWVPLSSLNVSDMIALWQSNHALRVSLLLAPNAFIEDNALDANYINSPVLKDYLTIFNFPVIQSCSSGSYLTQVVLVDQKLHSYCHYSLPGYYALNSVQIPCDYGFYQPNLRSTSCFACQPGSFGVAQKAQIYPYSCSLCSPVCFHLFLFCHFSSVQGKFNQNSNSSSPNDCLDCPAGSISSSYGARECTLCPAGTYQDQLGQIACLFCNENTYNPSRGSNSSSSCLFCPEVVSVFNKF